MMSRFPKITETFILHEICELIDKNWSVEIYPLLRHEDVVRHPEVERLLPFIHYQPFISTAILLANLKVFCSRPLGYLKTLLEVIRGTLASYNFLIGALGIFPKTVYFALQMEKSRIEHIHAHFANHPALAALIIHRLTGIPFSFTAHGSDIHVDQTMFGTKSQAASFVVTISDYNRWFLAEKCGSRTMENMKVIHCGLDMNDFQQYSPSQNNSSLQILCVAAFREVKGHRYLLEACKLLRERGISFECRLIGTYELENFIQQMIDRLQLENSVFIIGPQSGPKVKEHMRSSDVVVLPSIRTSKGHREGIPMVLMEGMASGRPVVASRISGIPELVEDGVSGLLCTPKAVHELADALEQLAKSPLLRLKMGKAGRKKVAKDFNRKDSIEQLTLLFKQSIGKRSKG